MRLGTAIERLFDNYVYASDKEWIRDKVAWALYQTWREADARKTEPSSSEKPNNCETCRYGQDKHRYAHICNECGVGINNYEPKTEPTGYNLSPVKDEPQTTDYCDVCNHKGCDNCVADGSNPYCVPSQFEPMALNEAIRHAEQIADSYKDTEPNCKCAEEHRQLAEWLKELRERRAKDEPQTDGLFTDKYGDVWEWRGDAWYCISGEDEPQTDCAWK